MHSNLINRINRFADDDFSQLLYFSTMTNYDLCEIIFLYEFQFYSRPFRLQLL